jgi:UDP-N-acetylmuramate dehydrogenase
MEDLSQIGPVLRGVLAGHVEVGAALAPLTTFGIGGPADVLVVPDCEDDVRLTIRVCTEMHVPLYVMGAGSNVLVPDDGMRGVVLRLSPWPSACADVEGRKARGLTRLAALDGTFVAGAGVTDERLAEFALQHGVTGFEWIYDIPGSVGGAVYMNAGNNDGEMKGNLVSVRWVDVAGAVHDTPVGELEMGYRTSRFQRGRGLVLEATLSASRHAAPEAIRAEMDRIRALRKSKFPEQTLCAGSIFKRPTGHFAGRLIEEAGLGGERVGGAMVSHKHKGFIVNMGGATAADVLALMQRVRERVQATSGVLLDPEVELLTDRRFCQADTGLTTKRGSQPA